MVTRKKLRFADNLQKTASYANAPLVAVNDAGRRIGTDNHKAVLSDHEIDLMRTLHEEHPAGHPEHLGYRKLAAKFGVTKTAARKICTYRVRAQHPARFKRGTRHE